jgi:hypothetical protein
MKIPNMKIATPPQWAENTEFNFDNKEANLAAYFKFKEKKLIEEFKFDESVLLYSFPKHYILLDHAKQEVLYYMEYQEKDILGYPSYTQKKVWKKRPSKYTRLPIEDNLSIAAYVLLKLLLPKKHIITDNLQTKKGSEFWESLVDKSFERGIKVQIVDLVTKDIFPVKNMEEFEDIIQAKEVYGYERKHQNKRIVLLSDYTIT